MWVEEASTVDISNITRFFTNQQYDRESGLYYYNARYYDPHLGSFITPDPAMQGLNHYNYCASNPIKYIDPTGLFGTNSSDDNPGTDSGLGSGPSNDDDDTTSTNNTPTGGGSPTTTSSNNNAPKKPENKPDDPNNVNNNNLDDKDNKKIDYESIKALTQVINNKEKYPNECQIFATIRAGLRKGYTPHKKGEELAEAISKMVKEGKEITDIIKEVFAKDIGDKKLYYDRPKSKTVKGLNKEMKAKNYFGLLVYKQKDFWGNKAPDSKVHGIGLSDGVFDEPYLNKESKNFDDIKGNEDAKFYQYIPEKSYLWFFK